MPTYQYQCKGCGYELEEFQSMTEAPLVRCPACDSDGLVRVLGAGAGLIFKGSGFYLTDYKKTSPKAASQEKSEKAGRNGEGSPGGPTPTGKDSGAPKDK